MNIERIDDLIFRARAEAAAKTEAQPGSERDRLLRVAQEFESMLMLQMLKEMRKAGSWDEEEGKSGYGAETMLDTIDVELAGHLARVQGLGLGKQMLDALQRMEGGSTKQDPRVVPDGGSTKQDPRVLPDGGSTKQDPPYESPSVPVGRVLNYGPGVDPVLEIPEGTITSGYGWRQDPIHGAARFHRGIDIRAAYGQDVPSAAAGRVISAGTEGGYGQTVVIEHADGVRTRYAHLSTTMVAAGDEVGEGQVVGRAGRSGRATGTHLHFEVTNASGDALNPEYFSKLKAEREVADFTRASNSVLQETRR